MAKTSYTSLRNVAMSLSHFAQSQSTDQRCARLRACIIRAKDAGNVELLARLRTQWETLKAEMQAEDAQNVAAALVEETTDQPTQRATNKAAHALATSCTPVEVQPGVFLIPSATRGGTVHRVTGGRCSCESRGACWHLAAIRILVRARGQVLTA